MWSSARWSTDQARTSARPANWKCWKGSSTATENPSAARCAASRSPIAACTGSSARRAWSRRRDRSTGHRGAARGHFRPERSHRSSRPARTRAGRPRMVHSGSFGEFADGPSAPHARVADRRAEFGCDACRGLSCSGSRCLQEARWRHCMISQHDGPSQRLTWSRMEPLAESAGPEPHDHQSPGLDRGSGAEDLRLQAAAAD